jgi:hypothetical protein
MAYIGERCGLGIRIMNLRWKFESQAFSGSNICLVPGRDEDQTLTETRKCSPAL